MKKNDLLKNDESIIRVLAIEDDRLLFIDCIKLTMPKWGKIASIVDYTPCEEQALSKGFKEDIDDLNSDARKSAYQHYTMISGILPYVSDNTMRCRAIDKAAEEYHVSKKTIRKYLCRYLAYQNITALAPKTNDDKRVLSQDEKNMRWALNKFFYNKNRNSLHTAYTLMLKEKYCDGEGKLSSAYPSFYQFRYFYRKTKNMQTYYISREGLKAYQRNKRPCTSEGVRTFAIAPGVGMLDATVCDIYLVNEIGDLVGRPILTACIDAYSGLCCGYSLSWEGGVYSLRNLMVNIIADKVEHCSRFGIHINESDWPAKEIPGKLISDKGAEYTSDTFAQLAELGVMITNLPAYRPELKGPVEKFFDLVQDSYKPFLKGRGVIEPDYLERGAHDYRKDACLTIKEFEKIILHCILFHNSKRVFGEFPYTEAMIEAGIKPNANSIWEWGKNQPGVNLISVSTEQLVLTLLPRTIGKFTRFGLKANKMRYHHPNYVEKYLQGKEAVVAYNPEDVSNVWILENGTYIRFELIDSRFRDKPLDVVMGIKKKQRLIVGIANKDRVQAEMELATHIEVISRNITKNNKVNIKSIRETRRKELDKLHLDHVKEAGIDE
ncbi:Mu transposase C-terminal domain-containing protein [Acetivibrio mesophilus]|uniref:Integrase catalytic domain-containing protein n=1 Tax=Acetivibrio mesophilus TaxID=2487273 RepID=A0A4Q0I6U2_9FIRM|nr:Mu transposase C-terminal domain-containing protein [Acetivibrio mesophilus]RXE59637.1 hypothetical protein EFD62_06725 [Acetivibrio mesophilus]